MLKQYPSGNIVISAKFTRGGNFEVGETVCLVSVNKAHPEIQSNTINTEIINLKGGYETYSSSFKNTFSITKKREIYRPTITATVTRIFISCMIPLNKLLL